MSVRQSASVRALMRLGGGVMVQANMSVKGETENDGILYLEFGSTLGCFVSIARATLTAE